MLSDEIYEHIIYDKRQHISLAALPGMRDLTVTINGMSKAYAMTGWRLGYLGAPAPLCEQILKVQQHVVTCAPRFVQAAGVAALQGPSGLRRRNGGGIRPPAPVHDGRPELHSRRALPAAGGGLLPVSAESHIAGWTRTHWPKFMIEEAHVAVTPGAAFGSTGSAEHPAHLRHLHGEPAPGRRADESRDGVSVARPPGLATGWNNVEFVPEMKTAHAARLPAAGPLGLLIPRGRRLAAFGGLRLPGAGFAGAAVSFCRDFSHCRRAWMRPWNSMDVWASSPFAQRISISSFSMDITLKGPFSFSYFSPTVNSNSAGGFIFPSIQLPHGCHADSEALTGHFSTAAILNGYDSAVLCLRKNGEVRFHHVLVVEKQLDLAVLWRSIQLHHRLSDFGGISVVEEKVDGAQGGHQIADPGGNRIGNGGIIVGLLAQQAEAFVFKHRRFDNVHVPVDHRELPDVQVCSRPIHVYLEFLAHALLLFPQGMDHRLDIFYPQAV
ncbi:MAG: aminotransferase class I/II-fold pyridoxal phosphate-dependent enzyme [Desulfobacterales bacterium]|nr:aminotransferase class I/II-fold pyridoxal phosphate-dependent enzyme [Desulfobacterales bacterium]